jgi:hypothetical protein
LVPAYHRNSEVEALARAGIVCSSYKGGPPLEPNEKELESLLSPRVRALYLIHYLRSPQYAARWRAWCDEHDLLLIEGAAQALLSSRHGPPPVGSYGDLSTFCIYKTFGLPDGAAVISFSPDRPLNHRKHVYSLSVRELARVQHHALAYQLTQCGSRPSDKLLEISDQTATKSSLVLKAVTNVETGFLVS